MEFTNEIYFNKELTANETVIITYFGKLYSEHSEHISIVYGYGDCWYETTETPMKEIENGFEVTIDIKDYEKFNFCFKNNFNIWDNNYGCNYISPIAPKQNIEVNNTETSTTTSIDNNIVNGSNTDVENNIETSESEINEEENEDVKENLEADSTNETSENTENFENETTPSAMQDNLDTIFAALLDSILEEIPNKNTSINIDSLDGFGLQSVDEINEEPLACDNSSMDNILNSIINAEIVKPVSPTTNIVETDTNTEEASLFSSNEIELEAQNIVSGLPSIKSNGTWTDNFLNASYSLFKKLQTSCKKLGKLLKLKAQEYGIIKEK